MIVLENGHNPHQLEAFLVPGGGRIDPMVDVKTTGLVHLDLGKLLQQIDDLIDLNQPLDSREDGAHQLATASPLDGVVRHQGPGLIERLGRGVSIQDEASFLK
jgi:hypothetical protein